MGLASFLGIGKELASPIGAVGKVLDNLFTSKDEKMTHDEIMVKLLQNPNMAQVELNKIEASHRSVWVAGWRPAIGWVCALSLFFFYVPQFAFGAFVWIKIMAGNGWELIPYPVEPAGMTQLVMALLGMGALRGFDKAIGKSK